MHNTLVKLNMEQQCLLDAIKAAMQGYFGEDQRRIDHALAVTGYAKELLAYIDADPVVTLAAGYLHDIGIHEAERKHNSCAGNWQEIEGPAIARQLLEELSAEPNLIERVVAIVGKHHTRAGVDAPEFRIIWDADALVNFVEVFADKEPTQIEDMLHQHMVTEAGYRLAQKIFLNGDKA